MKQMNLEPITQNKVCQKEKDKYCLLTHIYGVQKDTTDDSTCKAANTDIKKRLLDTAEEGEGGMI